MATTKDILIPDIGNATDVEVIEILVNPGDTVAKDDSLVTLESDKASMEVPAPFGGVIDSISLKVGDKVSAGHLIGQMRMSEETASADKNGTKKEKPAPAATQGTAERIEHVVIPDIGTDADVDVIEVMISVGQSIDAEESLLTLEGEKASMEIPAPFSGEVEKVHVKVGDKVRQGAPIADIRVRGEASATNTPAQAETPAASSAPKPAPAAAASTPAPAETHATVSGGIYASPSVRRLARELDLNLNQITGTGKKGRITKDDLNNHIKARMQGGGAGLGIPSMPAIDFTKYGEIETQPLNKIKRLTATNLHRNWVTIPHVTQFDEADITDMESFRQAHKKAAMEQGVRLTPLAFIMKAVVAALRMYPQFNASLSADGQSLILKKYYHIGVAVETPNGLVVPVIRDVDQKGVYQLAKELGEVSVKAREKGLTLSDMEGSTFTISSLGGIGGTAFTPIVNAPDVAILGVSKAAMKPVYYENEFEPRLMLPLSLSYDHRVIDGAEGARFARKVAHGLSNLPTLIL